MSSKTVVVVVVPFLTHVGSERAVNVATHLQMGRGCHGGVEEEGGGAFAGLAHGVHSEIQNMFISYPDCQELLRTSQTTGQAKLRKKPRTCPGCRFLSPLGRTQEGKTTSMKRSFVPRTKTRSSDFSQTWPRRRSSRVIQEQVKKDNSIMQGHW